MKVVNRLIIVASLLILLCFSSVDKSFAAEHRLKDIHIHLFINSNGSADITETRVAHLSEGTENYIVINNLGKSDIKDFVVRENGKTYDSVKKWDLDASQAEKTFKNGIIKTKDGYELSWGIGDYGEHEYVLEYTVTNIIKQLDGSQMLFWQFINDQTNIPPENVTVEIETETVLTEEGEKIWGFGFPGQVQFQDGKIVAMSDQPLTTDNYVTILVQFKDGLFSTDDKLNQTFEEVKDEAFIGSDYGEKSDESKSSFQGKKPRTMMDYLFWSYEAKVRNIIILLVVILFIVHKLLTSSKVTKKKPQKYSKKYREEYYRDYPYDHPFIEAYYLLYMMGVSKFEELLSAFILKWINEERILMETEDVGFFNKKDVSAIHFLDKEMEVNSLEGRLFNLLLKAADSKDVLNKHVLGVWARRNKKEVLEWEKDVINESWYKLKNDGYVQRKKEKKFLFTSEDYVLTEKGYELEKRVHQYINYLHDFSLLNEQEAINVKIWDEIMIWAAVLGLTTVVRQQFKKLYPSYDHDSIYGDEVLFLTNSFSKRVSEGRTESRFAGLGGSASSGGGGGSYGGGSGGGTR